MTDQRFEEASDLAEGELVLGDTGGTSSVTATIDQGTRWQDTAYNLTVEGPHTYFIGAGKRSILVHNCNGMDVNPNQVQDQISEHVLARHGFDSEVEGAKFAEDLGADELFTGLMERLDLSNATGRIDESGNHEHILEWDGAGADGEGRVRVWMTPNGELGGMWPIK